MSAYAELHVHSTYSFLTGASQPEELVKRASELGLSALALTDFDGFPGVVRFTRAARDYAIPAVIGSELRMNHDNSQLLILAKNPGGYQQLSHEIGKALLASGKKGEAHYDMDSLAAASADAWYVVTGGHRSHVRKALEQVSGTWASDSAYSSLCELIDRFGKTNVVIELSAYGDPYDRERRAVLKSVADRAGIRCIATGDVHMATEADKPLADVLFATSHNTTLEDARAMLPLWPAVLQSAEQMTILHRDYPQAVAYAAQIGDECAFDFELIAPRLPPFDVPAGYSEETWLRELVYRGARSRYGEVKQAPDAWKLIDHELDVINSLGFAGYFLIVDEIVSFCKREGIWCQGRGSAANSAVCFALGITAVDAVRHKMLFERFLSPDRKEPPDIDLDIESGQRERVIQHIYQRYGRTKAAQVANVITYRSRSAVRDSARAFGYRPEEINAWVERKDRGKSKDDIPLTVMNIADRLRHLPRHLGIHSGGMVLCDRPVIDVCPVEWASKAGRTVLQWDKEDCADAGLVKFDLLGLGMLTALRIAFTHIQEKGILGFDGKPIGLHNIAQDDSRVYDLLCAADTVGVFQVESRAQMATLPRLRPRTFYDIVIEVALVRPGPIQGGSVHPYISRRRGREAVTYAHPLLKPALEKTLGVPLFQEQLMRIAIDTAGFTPAQADQLRKAMSSKRSHERVAQLREELINGMRQRGIDASTAEEIFHKLDAFADFGFPESHAFSFAYLVYASAWLKVHYPEHFYAALLCSQPMGFYSPQSLIADARLHGIHILPVDVTASDVTTSVQEYFGDDKVKDNDRMQFVDRHPDTAIRLGLDYISGLGSAVERIYRARSEKPFVSVADLAQRAHLSAKQMHILSVAGALAGLGVTRREGIWTAQQLGVDYTPASQWYQPTILGTEIGVQAEGITEMTPFEAHQADLRMTGITPFNHPVEFIRPQFNDKRILTIEQAFDEPVGKRIKIAGCITHRQRPRTAQGVTFLSLEDETGMMNIVCSAGMWKHFRQATQNNVAVVRGVIEKHDGAVNFIADGIERVEHSLRLPSRDFR
ncbi:error-prone DNA polymerase [Arcanobacterium phocisimile]|uniref:Error-prone DNA polymerase n=1 Tax=Arcanobacterium phocisimile TaxID=1302235 RepID=A0ABX7IHS8_9ACTO|nr:error-prone DNA polymerase [Arcanobacterium phocisimile]QRV01418.1 error-prone DNA polymerase [Arcanobacterium phocisimile]